jgi:hypothetical protein
MFPSIKSPAPIQNPVGVGQKPQAPGQVQVTNVEPIVYKPSPYLKRLKTINNWQFLILMFSGGVGIVHFFRLSSSHIFLGVVGIIACSVSLFVISSRSQLCRVVAYRRCGTRFRRHSHFLGLVSSPDLATLPRDRIGCDGGYVDYWRWQSLSFPHEHRGLSQS